MGGSAERMSRPPDLSLTPPSWRLSCVRDTWLPTMLGKEGWRSLDRKASAQPRGIWAFPKLGVVYTPKIE